MKTVASSTKTISGQWSGYALSMLEDMADRGLIALGTGHLTAISRRPVPTVLLAKNKDAEWALDMVSNLLAGREVA